MKTYIYLIIGTCATLLMACQSQNEEAQKQYEKALKHFEAGQLAHAKNAIDSIEIIAPEAFDEIKSGDLLMYKVIQKESEINLANIDSMLAIQNAEFKELTTNKFRLEKDLKHPQIENYVYNKLPAQDKITASRLSAQVSKSGELQLLSIYFGKWPIKHTSIRATLPDKVHAETLTIGYDGFHNKRVNDYKNNTEIITYKDGQCSALVALIANTDESNIEITYLGGERYTLKLDAVTHEAIRESRELANLMKAIAHLQQEQKSHTRSIELYKQRIQQLEEK